MRLAPRRAGAVVAAVALVALGGSTTASAAVPGADDGRWYYEATSMAEIHQRTTGEGITVALVDGPVNVDVSDLAGADIRPHEPSYCAETPGGEPYPATSATPDARHATSMATVLVGSDAGLDGQPGIPGIAPGITLRTYASNFDSLPCKSPPGGSWLADDPIRDAVAEGADIIFVPGTQDMSASVIAEAQRAGVIVIGAAGNDGTFVWGMPAALNGVVATGTLTADQTLDPGSPDGERLGVVAPGAQFRSLAPTWDSYGMSTGSSNSAAYTAGALALLWSLYPDATDGQILQALVRTTDGEVKDTWTHDPDWGYGVVNARVLMTVDPTTFPDVNPFVDDDPNAMPTAAEILGQADPTSPTTGDEPSATADPRDVPGDASGTRPVAPDTTAPGVGAILGAAAGVVALGAVVTLVLARRRRDPAVAVSDHHDAPPTDTRGNHG
ncbi:MAG: S8 family serine peptidase [Micrococcales bacterium]|nr:S8 family serine peptidase [Micrococcales bacterium]